MGISTSETGWWRFGNLGRSATHRGSVRGTRQPLGDASPERAAFRDRCLVCVSVVCLGAVVLTGCSRRVPELASPGAEVCEETSFVVEADEPERTPSKSGTELGSNFRFPDDRGGKLLADLLAPPVRLPPDEFERSTAPRAAGPSRLLD